LTILYVGKKPKGDKGVIAWAIYDAMRIKTEALQDSDFIGNIEDSVTLTGKVLSTKNIEGYYGMSLLVTFLVNGKDIVKTFTTCKAAYALEVGEEVSFSGIVKSHDTYMDKKSTMLKKIKIH